jgi:hypothetical protein
MLGNLRVTSQGRICPWSSHALMGRPGFDKKKEEFERSSLGVRRRFL